MMRIGLTFWRYSLIWTAFLAGGLLVVSAASGSLGAALDQIALWTTTAFVLAAYPGGLATAPHVFAREGARGPRAIALVAAAGSASLCGFLITNVAIPALGGPPTSDVLATAPLMTLGELKAALLSARTLAEAGPPTPDTWLPYNHLAFTYVRRVEGMLLPALFGVVGLLVGYWTLRAPKRHRSLAVWGVGAFILVTTYFAGENSYEMIVLVAAGPAEFAGDLVLIVPVTLVAALSLSVLMDLASGSEGT